VLPPPSGPVPSVVDVVAQFRRVLAGDDPDAGGPVLDALLELLRTNVAQWRLEDATRAPDSSDAVVAMAKRGIDALNLRRHECVEAVDAEIGRALAQTPSAPPATESPAMAFDRLSVLVIRIHHTEMADAYAARLPSLYHQLEVLETALEALMSDVRGGTRSFLPYQHLKLYASPTG
jgi:hypothetical protein